MALQPVAGNAVVADVKEVADDLQGLQVVWRDVIGIAEPQDRDKLETGLRLLECRLSELARSCVGAALCRRLLLGLSRYAVRVHDGKRKAAQRALLAVVEAAALIRPAAECGPVLLASLLHVPQKALLLLRGLLHTHVEAMLKEAKAKSSREAAVEAQLSSCERAELDAMAAPYVRSYAKDDLKFIGGTLIFFAERHDLSCNAGALQQYSSALARASCACTEKEALDIIDDRGAPHLQAVFSAQVQHLVDASRPLAAAAPLLEDEAALPDGFRVACLTTFMLMNQLDQLLARMKAHGTLPSGFFSARGIADEGWVSAQLSQITIGMAPILAAYRSTAVAAGGSITEEARRVVAAQATDRQLRLAGATHEGVEEIRENQSVMLELLMRMDANQAAAQKAVAAALEEAAAARKEAAAAREEASAAREEAAAILASQQQLAAYQQTANTQSAALLAQGQLLAQQQGCSMAVHAATLALAGNPALAQKANQNLSANRARLTSAAASPAKPFTGFPKLT